MKTLLPIVLAAVLAAPVQADDCSDFRRSVRERDAAMVLLSEPATDEEDRSRACLTCCASLSTP